MVFGCAQLGFLQNLTAYSKAELGKAEKVSGEEVSGW